MLKNLFYLIFLIPVMGISQYDVEGWSFLGEGTLNGEEVGENFGWSSSTNADGSIVAVGAPYNGGLRGYVKVYQYTEGSWTQLGEDIEGGAEVSFTGQSVSLNEAGDILAIGEPYNPDFTGKVRVFHYDGTSWVPLGQDINGTSAYDFFGYSVSVSAEGNQLAVGALYNLNNSLGYVRIYNYDGENWIQVGQDIVGDSIGDRLGFKVDMSSDGTTVIMGAPQSNMDETGYVKIYTYNGTSWEQKGQTLEGTIERSVFGESISINENGNIVAIGAPNTNSTQNTSDPGHVWIYSYNADSETWLQLGLAIEGEEVGSYFGESISLNSSGNRLAISAYGAEEWVGKAKVLEYDEDSNSWHQLGADIYGYNASFVYFGMSISLSSDGNKVAVGAVPDGNTGNVYVFEYIGDDPTNVEINTLEGEDTEIHIDETLQLTVNILPEDADQEAIWSISSGEEFVSINESGLVTGLSAGVATIRATSVHDATIFSEIEITVINSVASVMVNTENNVEAEILVSETIQLEAAILPEDANQEVIWSISSGDGFASIDENGLVTGLEEGIATIRATSGENETIYGEIEVTVIDEIMSMGDLDNNNFVYYPNPVKDILTLRSKEKIESISIYNLSGAVVKSQNTSSKEIKIDFSDLAPGIYVVKIITENKKENIKVVKR